MSSLGSLLSIAQTGLQVAQTGLDVVSNNVANVNTTGYVREIVNQSSTSAGGVGTGVLVDGIARGHQHLSRTGEPVGPVGRGGGLDHLPAP